MKISAKARYALAALTSMAQNQAAQECVTLPSLSKRLEISKIYLEQIFSSLRQAGIVKSIKGAQGGYLLARSAKEISVYDVLSGIESGLFAENDKTVEKSAPNIEKALQNCVLNKLDQAIVSTLANINLDALVQEAEKHNEAYMYYL